MKTFLLILFTACLFSSCVTIFNDKHKIVGIFTNKPASVIYQNDTFLTDKKNRLLLPVLRRKESLNFIVFDDSLSKKVTIPSKISPTFFGNIYNGIQPVGFFIDWKNPKKYTYSDRIYINLNDTINDFESVSAWACKLKNIPCIGMSHQWAILHKNTPRPASKDLFGTMILKYLPPAKQAWGFILSPMEKIFLRR